jgi:hypothetical protein
LEVSIPLGCTRVAHETFDLSIDRREVELQEQDLTEIINVLRDSARLEIFAVTITSLEIPEASLGRILAALSATLETLLWYSPFSWLEVGGPLFERMWLEFFDNHPLLATIDTPYSEFDLPSSPSLRHVHWHSVRHWSVRVDFAAPLPSEMLRNLETLSFLQALDGTMPSFTDFVEDFCTFVSVQGRRLTSITLVLSQGPLPISALVEVLETVKSGCPLLRQIQFLLSPLAAQSDYYPLDIEEIPASVQLPTVRMLGLGFSSLDIPMLENLGVIEWYHALMLPWRKLFPKLEVLRLLLEADVEGLRTHGIYLKKVVESCSGASLVLEDNFGRALTEDG